MIDLTSMGTLRCCVGEDNDPIDPAIVNLFALPTIGQPGNLSRNAGSGPGFLIFDLSVTFTSPKGSVATGHRVRQCSK